MAVKQAVFGGFLRIAGSCGLVFGLCLAVAGCAESVGAAPGSLTAQNGSSANAIRPSGYSPSPAALAVTQMEGAPTPLQTQFMALFDADVAQQQVTLTDQAGARYLARGYISAFPVDGGAKLTYVWDIYDRSNHRAQRLNDEIALKGSSPDPWSLVDSSAIAALASRSAHELAAYLSNTPEAMAAAMTRAPAQAATAPQAIPQAAPQVAAPGETAAPAQALSYAGER